MERRSEETNLKIREDINDRSCEVLLEFNFQNFKQS